MKKIVSLIVVLMIISVAILTGNVYAAPLNSVNVETSKDLVRPGEEVRVNIEFGQALGSYTFDIAYDNSIFEYVSSEGGTPNNTGTKVRVVFYDSTGGTNPRTNMSVTFKAKSDITTSNPTEFNVTAEGLANSDASVNYDDITSPITKNVTVEPEYIDYTLNLESVNENLLKNDIKLSDIENLSDEEVIDILVKKITEEYEAKIKEIPQEVTDEFEKAITLQVVDNYWMEHINTMSHLREGIHLRGYAQEDPLRAYTMEGYDMFDEMLQKIDRDVTTFLLRAEIRQNIERKEVVKKKVTNEGGKEPAKKQPKRVKKIGRNEPCPCGSGKKYKNCCGKNA